MLIEKLFSSGVMQMGPSRNDPGRQVGVFNPAAVAGLPELRASRIDEFRWIAGEWHYENAVPATSANPAYCDIGTCRYSLCEKNNWICMVAPEGREMQQITFDPFSKHWIYVLMSGAYGIAALARRLERQSDCFYRPDDHDWLELRVADVVDEGECGSILLRQRRTRWKRLVGLHRRVALHTQERLITRKRRPAMIIAWDHCFGGSRMQPGVERAISHSSSVMSTDTSANKGVLR